ncbi:MAG: hypothetical protein HY562_04490 [Ignavibacteriales bacterium]|nr:hypothetical protein [Ignavibacteriales bacterium]
MFNRLQSDEHFNILKMMNNASRRRRSFFGFLVLVTAGAFAFLINSCEDVVEPDQTIGVVFPDSNVSYSQHIEPLFQQGCAFSSCHGTASQAGLNLESPSYSKLMNHQPRLVVAMEAENSLLVQRLDGRIQPQMPLNRKPLNENQINGVKKWINEGAANN